MTTFRTPDKRELSEHPTIARYTAPCGIIWVCLVTGHKKSDWFVLADLEDVTPGVDCSWMRGMADFARLQFDSGLLYTVAERPALPIVIEMTEAMLRSVVGSHGVDIRVVEKPTVCMDWLKYAPLFITPKNVRVYWAAEVQVNCTSEAAAA